MPASPEQLGNPNDSEKKIPEIVVDGDELLNILNASQFKSGVTTIAGRAKKIAYDTEGGFTIFRGLTNAKTTLAYSMDVGHLSTGMSKAEHERHNKLYSTGNFPLINLHFHPLGTRQVFTYAPSESDLANLTAFREVMRFNLGYDGNPVGVIAIVKGKNIDLVLYQGTGKMPTPNMFSFYGEDLITNESIDDVINLLGNYGFKAAIIPYVEGRISPQSEEKVKDFAFALTPFKVTTP